jgi:hypothetical protein
LKLSERLKVLDSVLESEAGPLDADIRRLLPGESVELRRLAKALYR